VSLPALPLDRRTAVRPNPALSAHGGDDRHDGDNPVGSPWAFSDVMTLLVVFAAGLIGSIIAWYGAAGEGHWSRQIGWLVGSLASVAVMVLACLMYLAQGVRTVHVEKARLLSLVRDQCGTRPSTPGGGTSASVAASEQGAPEFRTADRMTQYHLQGCRMLSGKDLRAVSPQAAHRQGLVPCRVCMP
jgi:hypothetical protein